MKIIHRLIQIFYIDRYLARWNFMTHKISSLLLYLIHGFQMRNVRTYVGILQIFSVWVDTNELFVENWNRWDQMTLFQECANYEQSIKAKITHVTLTLFSIIAFRNDISAVTIIF